jgi:hypothetical protein
MANDNAIPPARCQHGVYIVPGDSKAQYCTLCNPEGNTGPVPILPKSSSDPLKHESESIEFCPGCGNVRLSSSDCCNVCGYTYEEIGIGRYQSTANSKQPGICPECGSAVHYEFKPGVWECADCGKMYPSRKRK